MTTRIVYHRTYAGYPGPGTYRLKQKTGFVFRAFGLAARNFVWDECVTVSASISFVFLLSIIPFSALFLFLLNLIKNIFLPGLFPENMVAILVDDVTQFIPFVSRQWVQTHLIDSVGLGSFTTINLLMMPIVSGLLFKSLEESFRRIFHLKRRTLFKGHMMYAFLSVFAILVFFMANFLCTVAAEAVQPVKAYLDDTPFMHDLYALAIDYFIFNQIDMVSALLLTLFFLITVKIFLSLPIHRKHRIAGALLFTTLWMAARYLFGIYIQHVSQINVLFGSLSSVCIILLWIFYSAIALLYAVEFMYVLHCGPCKRWDRRPKTK
ncbi:MAG: YihY/virulence factor BrkB family protein [Desulfatitalea sp.]|nr:YihY/virulence factor BrkB family protein [Desulfatitalea sp.]NNK00354.1 YihY/virulence factor BrkB family protein [Desulfatitalea sp.]